MSLSSFDSSHFFLKNNPQLRQWAENNANLTRYINVSILNQKINFSKLNNLRFGKYNRIIEDLFDFIELLNKKIEKIKKDINLWSDSRDFYIDIESHDNKNDILTLRKYSFLLRKKQKLTIQLLTKKFEFLIDYQIKAQEIIKLFSGNIIPNDTIFSLEPSFFQINIDNIGWKESNKLSYLIPYTKRMKATVMDIKESLWKTDFKGYIVNLVNELLKNVDTELSYCYPSPKEDSLSRCFFNKNSPFLSRIDATVRNLTENNDEYSLRILDLCYNLMPKENFTFEQQSVIILIFFRAIFNRGYEICSSYFAPKINNDIYKIEELKKLPLKLFTLPYNLIRKDNHDLSIGEFFRKDPQFNASSYYLSLSIFCSNPIDALFHIHKSLTLINKGALINKLENRIATVKDISQILCFDDLFSLFFGTLMASDLPDVFFVSWFINKFAPTNCLSPSFEYSQANIEALVLHCKNINLEDLKKQSKI